MRAGAASCSKRDGLGVWAIGAHLVGQAVCDPIDERHRAILPPDVYGDGEPEGVRTRAAERMKDTARAAVQLGVTQVNGFTGSSIWHLIYSFPPNDFAAIERGYEDFAERWGPIIDVFDAEGVRFGLEVHPTEIAYDFVTTRKTLDAIGNREAFGINLDPSHFAPQGLDAAQFALEFADRIYHVHVKDSIKRLDGRRSILGSHLNFGEEARGWDFVSPGHGDVDFENFFRASEPHRLSGPAVDRMGGQRDGSRLGCARRARVRPPHGLRPVRDRVRRCDAEGRRMSGGIGVRASGPAGDAVRPIGVGMLGYAFMGKAHANAYRKLAYMTWPPPLMPRLVSLAGRDEEAVAAGGASLRLRTACERLARAGRRSGRRALRQQRSEQPARRARRLPQPRRASTSSARSRWDGLPTRAMRSGSACRRPA